MKQDDTEVAYAAELAFGDAASAKSLAARLYSQRAMPGCAAPARTGVGRPARRAAGLAAWRTPVLLTVLLALLWQAAPAQRGGPATGQPALPEPPGTIQLSENLFVDESEVANIHWQEYLQRASG